MHLYKRKDSKFWWYKFEMDGVAYRASTGTKNRRDAEGIASKARLDAIEGKYSIKRQKATPLFKDAMARYLKHAKEQLAERTAKRYQSSSKILIEVFGAKKLHQITADEVEKFKDWRMSKGKKRPGPSGAQVSTGKGVKPATIGTDLACMKAMYSYFISLDIVSSNPVSRVKLPPADNPKTRVLSFEEERLYLAACSQPLHDIAALMLDTGVRPGEAFDLRCENVGANYIFIPKGKSKAARRKLTLTRHAAEVLASRIADDERVFPGADHNSMDWAHQAALKASGVEYFTLHALRHTFATRAVEAGVDLVTLKDLLGHSRLEMVMRYAHPQSEHKAQAIRTIEKFVITKQMEEAARSEMIQ